MENIVENLSFSGNREHFWGAVQIYTDKSHILNRKVCGSSYLHIGVCGEDRYKNELNSLIIERIAQITSPDGNDLNGCSSGDESPTKKMHLSENCQHQQQIETLLEILGELGFEFKRNYDFSDPQHTQLSPVVEAEEESTSQSLENSDRAVAPNSTGTLNIPWHEFATQKKIAVAVIRKIHPKQLQKYTPQLEVILLGKYCLLFLAINDIPCVVHYKSTMF